MPRWSEHVGPFHPDFEDSPRGGAVAAALVFAVVLLALVGAAVLIL